MIAVFLYHLDEESFSRGYLGVDAFFVVSGFVITPLILGIFATEGPSKKLTGKEVYKRTLSFYRSRLFRLAPALLVMLGIASILMLLFGYIYDHQRYIYQGLYSILGLSNFGAYTLSGDYFFPSENPLIHTWSLAVEVQIYSVLPIILLSLFLVFRNVRYFARVFLLLALFSFILLLVSQITTVNLIDFVNNTKAFAFYSPVTRIWEFSLGAILFINKAKVEELKVPSFYKTFARLVFLILLFSPFQANPMVDSLIICLSTVAILAFGAFQNDTKRLSLSLASIGDRSYSIYLYHLPVIYCVESSLYTFNNSPLITSLVSIFLCGILAELSYRQIELRFKVRNSGDKKVISMLYRKTLLTLIVAVLGLVILSFSKKNNYWSLETDSGERPVYAADVIAEYQDCTSTLCIHPENSNDVALLLGDSFAGEISLAVQEAADIRAYSLAIDVDRELSCEFANPVAGVIVGDYCPSGSASTLNWISTNNPRIIIVSNFIESPEELEIMKSVLERLKTKTERLVWIETKPIFPDDKFFSPRPIVIQLISSLPKYPTQFNLSEMELSYRSLSDEFIEWAQAREISVVRTFDLICSTQKCTRFSKAGWLYRDFNHFSVLGASLIKPQLIPLFP